MNKFIGIILFASVFILSGQAHSEEKSETVDHSGHSMDHDDHSGHTMSHDDHSDHSMDHDDHIDHNLDHSDHTGHEGHDHSMHDDDHEMDEPGDHSMHHSDMDHSMHHGDHHDHGDGHIMDHEGGMIMGQNFDNLPSSCDSISEEIEITVRAGREFAAKFPGTVFAFDKQEWRVKPCSKITWHFVNEDEVRHQFMIHGLPRYIYPNGMFHLESTGPRTISGTLIVPASDETYLAHCDISQHMEKGMKAQLVVGNGSEDLTSIPGITPYAFPDTYKAEELPQVVNDSDDDTITEQITDFLNENSPMSLLTFIGLLIGLISMPVIFRIVALLRKKEPETTT